MRSYVEALGENYALDDQNNITDELIQNQFALAMERIPRLEKKKRGRPEEWAVVTAIKEARAAKKARIAEENSQEEEEEED